MDRRSTLLVQKLIRTFEQVSEFASHDKGKGCRQTNAKRSCFVLVNLFGILNLIVWSSVTNTIL